MSKSSHPPSHRPSRPAPHFDVEKKKDLKGAALEALAVEVPPPSSLGVPNLIDHDETGRAREAFESKLHSRTPADKPQPATAVKPKPPNCPHFGETNHNGFYGSGHPSPGT